jgi:hypothetical protein
MLFVRIRKLLAVSLSFSNSLERFRIAARIRSTAALLRGIATIDIGKTYRNRQWNPPQSSASVTPFEARPLCEPLQRVHVVWVGLE